MIAGALTKAEFLKHIGELAKQDKLSFISKWDGANMVAISDWINSYFLLTVIFLIIVIALLLYFGKLLYNGKSAKLVNIYIVLATLFLLFYFGCLVPFLYKNESVKDFCKQSQSIIPKNAVICHFGDWNTEAVFFNDRKHTITSNFYNEKADKFKFIVTSPDAYEVLSENTKKKAAVTLSTTKNIVTH